MSRRIDRWIGNESSAVTIAGKTEHGRRVLTKQREIGRMRAVSHCERAAKMVLGFIERYLRLLAKGYVLEVYLFDEALWRGKASDQPVEMLRVIELEVSSGIRES